MVKGASLVPRKNDPTHHRAKKEDRVEKFYGISTRELLLKKKERRHRGNVGRFER